VLAAVALLGLAPAVFLNLHYQEVNAFAQAVWGRPGADFFFVWLLAFSPIGRLPPFLIGIATAHIFITRYQRPVGESEQRFGMILLTLALTCVLSMVGAQSAGNPYASLAALFVYSLSIAVIIFCCARYRSIFSRILAAPLLIACGDASYSIYLFHQSIIEVTEVREVLPWTWYNVLYVNARFATTALVTIVFSVVMYRAYEAPARAAARALLRRFTAPEASRAAHCLPVVLCVGVPVTLSLFGWFISLR